MSFLAAIYQRNGAPARLVDIERMAQVLESYAPGRATIRMLGPVAMAVITQSFTPEDEGQVQPVSGGGGRFTMIFDGRLDNRADVIRALGIPTVDAERLSDADLMMRMFERRGIERLNDLVGEFACVIWDEHDRRLTIITDQLGRRGLVYHDSSDRLVLSTMIQPILTLPNVPRVLNEERLADALSQLVTFQSETLFRGIHGCPAGTVMTATATGLRETRYYRFRDHVRPVRYRTDEEYVEAARALFEQSVRASLRSNGPVGAFMSGGLDSSTGAVVAARILAERGQRLPAFTSVPEAGWDRRVDSNAYGDETPYVRMIAKQHPAIDLNLIDSAGRSHCYRQDAFLRLVQMPLRNAMNLHWSHSILEAAADQGMRVMLQGQSGNMTLSHRGGGVYYELLRSGRLRQFREEARRAGAAPIRLAAGIALSAMPDAVWDLKERLRGRPSMAGRWANMGVIRPEFGRAMRVMQRARESGFNFFGRPAASPRAGWYWSMDQVGGAATTVSAAFRAMYGIEQRDPFFDRRLVEWSFGVPETQYHRNGVGRSLIKRMMEGVLPHDVLHKPHDVGRQAADWHLRMSRDLDRMKADLAAMARDPDLTRMIDIPRMQAMLAEWPEETITDPFDVRRIYLPVVIPMAMQIGRFVQIEEEAARRNPASPWHAGR